MKESIIDILEQHSLEEMTRYKKEKGEKFNPYEGLRQYADGNHFLHFSDLEKLGINPKSNFDTPIGVYGYIFSSLAYKQLLGMSLEPEDRSSSEGLAEFARDRKFVHVFTFKEGAKIVELDRNANSANYTEEDMERDVDILEKIYVREEERTTRIRLSPIRSLFRTASQQAYHQTPFGKIWNLTRMISKDLVDWNRILRKDLGIDIIIDRGSGLIHTHEPAQVVFLNPAMIKQVDKVKNDFEENTQPVDRLTGLHFYNHLKNAKVIEELKFHGTYAKYNDITITGRLNCDKLSSRFIDYIKKRHGFDASSAFFETGFTPLLKIVVTAPYGGVGMKFFIQDFDSGRWVDV